LVSFKKVSILFLKFNWIIDKNPQKLKMHLFHRYDIINSFSKGKIFNLK
jgi:hypothetical protein